MNPRGLRDLDPLGNHKHPCASRAGVYIGFCGALNPVDPSDSSYNLYFEHNHTSSGKKTVTGMQVVREKYLHIYYEKCTMTEFKYVG